VRHRGSTAVMLTSFCLAGCKPLAAPPVGPAPAPAVVVEDVPEWQQRAASSDIKRLERLDDAWREALSDARAAGFARQIAAEGRLLQPGAALPSPAPTPGSYTCRVIRLGAAGRGRALQSFRPFFCYVGTDGDLLSITKQTGSERPGGYLWPDDRAERLVFLGSVALGTEDMPLPYGEDPARDMIGAFERVGPFRFRLVVPWPRNASKLDVFELTPAPVQRSE